MTGPAERIASIDWGTIGATLDDQGFAPLPPIVSPADCAALSALYNDDARFRSRIEMERFRFGVGEYKYFAAPLPPLVQALRSEIYPRLVTIANRWMTLLKTGLHYPAGLDAFLGRCHAAGQRRPTPLLLRYGAGGYNCLHQDLYGELAFPLQVTCVLSRRGVDYEGGELVLVEQRPRAQSRAEVITLERGEAIVFPNRYRPVAGARGTYRVNVRHGIGRVREGERLSLGIIFHDAE